MSVRAYFDVWCDIEGPRCRGWCEQATAMEYEGRQKARWRAKREGWVVIQRDGKRLDVCPNCAATSSQEAAPEERP